MQHRSIPRTQRGCFRFAFLLLSSLPIASCFSHTTIHSINPINSISRTQPNNVQISSKIARPHSAFHAAGSDHDIRDTKMFNIKNQSSLPVRPIQTTLSALATLSILNTLLLSPIGSHANAYEESDYASETVTNVVQRLKDTSGDVDGTFRTLEEVAAIITEGRGVGGSLSYSGVKLTEGFVADEDTTIYNPGLTLLTSSEKERIVTSLIQNRNIGLSTNHWSENNEFAFDFLKQKLDPLHMYELEGYLKILPFWGAVLYLGALFVQQNARGVFPLVYGVCALAVFGPVFVLVASGP